MSTGNHCGSSHAQSKEPLGAKPVPNPEPVPGYCQPDSPFRYQHQPGLVNSDLFCPRLGYLQCPHGSIETPNFIFCGTKANVKGISSSGLRATYSDIILANTYHLMLSPGADLIAQQGGLHRFMRWDGPLLSDSGGYQVFAMGHGSVSEEIKSNKSKRQDRQNVLLKITEDGVHFRSYTDGSRVFLSPESSVQIQRQLGVDFMVQFDECTPYHVSREYTESSMEMSLRWGKRSLDEFTREDDGSQAIYGVIQGGIYPELRRRSAAGIAKLPFFGTAIGGCLGKTRTQMWEVTARTAQLLPPERPIHLLGIGYIIDIFWGVLQGIDTFDCVQPTRLARHGCAILPHTIGLSRVGTAQVNLRQSRFRCDKQALFSSAAMLQPCSLPEELAYSKAYVHHLLRTGEMLGSQILTINNVLQMNALMHDIRMSLRENCFAEVLQYWLGLGWEEFLAYAADSPHPT